ncbi:MAG: DUF58 domain-containing protein [Steroidobacteraceae bacterium]
MATEFHYRIPWRPRGQRPGHHRGSVFGAGQEFGGYAPLGRAPDPRRLDPRATLADPLGTWQVRLYQQRAAIPVWLIADLSGSMGAPAGGGKLQRLGEIAASLAYSVHRTGDAFGFMGCDDQIVSNLLLPPTHARGAGAEVAARLAGYTPASAGARGLPGAAAYLGRRRALVFLASDFHFPQPLLEAILESLAPHDVVPVVVWDELRSDGEFQTLPRVGLVELRDAESGRRRTVLLRPRLHAQWRHEFAQRRTVLHQCFARFGLRPFHVGRQFHPQALTAYFYGGDTGAHE